MRTMLRSVVPAVLLLASGSAIAHNHVTVDTPSGAPGQAIFIDAGYYASETSYSIFDGELLHDGDIARYGLHEELALAGFVGWWAGDGLTLTSDFYFATGRLAGGNFGYEIVGVSPVSPDANPSASFAWGRVGHSGTTTFSALSTGATRSSRSFMVGAGGHPHGQVYAMSHPGVYDISIVAWDANGVYADSEPMTFRVVAGPLCPPDANGDTTLDAFDFNAFVDAFNAGHLEVADQNGDTTLDAFDFNQFVDNFNAGCN